MTFEANLTADGLNSTSTYTISTNDTYYVEAFDFKNSLIIQTDESGFHDVTVGAKDKNISLNNSTVTLPNTNHEIYSIKAYFNLGLTFNVNVESVTVEMVAIINGEDVGYSTVIYKNNDWERDFTQTCNLSQTYPNENVQIKINISPVINTKTKFTILNFPFEADDNATVYIKNSNTTGTSLSNYYKLSDIDNGEYYNFKGITMA